MANGEGIVFIIHHISVYDAGFKIAVRVPYLGATVLFSRLPGRGLPAGAAAGAGDVQQIADIRAAGAVGGSLRRVIVRLIGGGNKVVIPLLGGLILRGVLILVCGLVVGAVKAGNAVGVI